MGSKTDISWCNATFNPWRGCTKIAAGCSRCYADTLSKRNPGTLGVWGPNGKRVVAAESYWRLPEKWDKQAAKEVVRRKVFLGSLMDIFEDWPGPMVKTSGETLGIIRGNSHSFPRGMWVTSTNDKFDASDGEEPLTMQDVRNRVFSLIDRTPHLTWLLLTKRPENAESMVPWKHVSYVDAKSPAGAACSSMFDPWPSNLWLGYSIAERKDLEKLHHLRDVPAAVRFLSIEPLLEDLGDLSPWIYDRRQNIRKAMAGPMAPNRDQAESMIPDCGVGWVIVGSESGGKVTGDINLFPEELQRREMPV